MKDKKFLVLCGLGLVWLVMLIAMFFGARISPRIEVLIYLICVGWFAYWTLSTVREYFRKDTSPTPPTQPTEQTQPNAKSEKTPKSE